MDFPSPIPVGPDSWLWTYLAPDRPSVSLRQNAPADRHIVTLDSDWELQTVVARVRPGPSVVQVDLGPVEWAFEAPLSDHPLVEVSPDGQSVFVLERRVQLAAWTNTFRITEIDLAGDTVRQVLQPAPYRPVTDADFERLISRVAAHPAAEAALPGMAGAREALIAGAVARSPFHPPVSDMVIGEDGSIWLRWPEDDPSQVLWQVLDSEGESRYHLWAAPELRIVAASLGDAWGVLRDEDGVTQLYRLRLVPAGPPN